MFPGVAKPSGFAGAVYPHRTARLSIATVVVVHLATEGLSPPHFTDNENPQLKQHFHAEAQNCSTQPDNGHSSCSSYSIEQFSGHVTVGTPQPDAHSPSNSAPACVSDDTQSNDRQVSAAQLHCGRVVKCRTFLLFPGSDHSPISSSFKHPR